jgi:hypothetical protein
MVPIDRNRVTALAGIQNPDEFLALVKPRVRAMLVAIARITAMFDAEPNPIRRLVALGPAVDWWRLRDDDHVELFEFAKEALQHVERHHVIALKRKPTRSNRRATKKHEVLLKRLRWCEKHLADFVRVYPRAAAWIRENEATLLSDFGNTLGCSVVTTQTVLTLR